MQMLGFKWFFLRYLNFRFDRFVYIPLRLRKAGRVWCGGAQETNWATCHNRVTPRKTKESLKSSRFYRSLWYNDYINYLYIITLISNPWKINIISKLNFLVLLFWIWPIYFTFKDFNFNLKKTSVVLKRDVSIGEFDLIVIFNARATRTLYYQRTQNPNHRFHFRNFIKENGKNIFEIF